jgi:beta-glucosidase
MKKKYSRVSRLVIVSLLFGTGLTCQSSTDPAVTKVHYQNPEAAIEARVADLLGRMTLEEKIGQMAQVEKNSAYGGTIAGDKIGSVLSGGGGNPVVNNPTAWADMTDGFQKQALNTRFAIPLLYGTDAVHGHNNVRGAVIFPHNIGLGAAADEDLAYRIGRATAIEMCATGASWNFAPVVAVPQDIRWGRTYEAYSENTALVTKLAIAYMRGLQTTTTGGFGSPGTVLATPKHFIGDGGTVWNTTSAASNKIDQGVTEVDEATLRRLFLPPYAAAVKSGARCIMVSFSSWRETKMHAHTYLLSQVLKGELGFSGFLISDWKAINQLPGDYHHQVVTSINAGLDMIMTPYDSRSFCEELKKAVENGEVPPARIDDAVSRILRVKFELGLFERPLSDRSLLAEVGSAAHRALAREAVRRSLVLLKNNNALPLAKTLPLLLVAGQAAEDLGRQCGGWTIEWQGGSGAITQGTTILAGIRSVRPGKDEVRYNAAGRFDDLAQKAAVGIVVVGETSYAEGVGDSADLSLRYDDVETVKRIRTRCEKLVVVVISGRPLIITEILPLCDAVVAAWLPGTEGAGVADVLFGDFPFTGKLPYIWPKSMADVPLAKTIGAGVLFPFGFGLN